MKSIRRGLSNIVAIILILIIVFDIMIMFKNNVDNMTSLYNSILSGIKEKYETLSENINVINNGSLIIESDPGCPIKYLVIYYNNTSVTILQINSSSVDITKYIANSTKIFVITCSGNIVRVYYTAATSLQYNGTANESSLYIRSYFFQPGKKEFLDPSICPIIFHRYNNNYSIIEVNTTFSLFCYNESGLVYDPPTMYFYNIFLVDSSNETSRISLFSKGSFSIKYNTRNVVLYFLARLYDAISSSSIENISYSNILNLKEQKAVQETTLINGTTSYLYAWPQYSSISIDGNFLLFFSYDLDRTKFASPIIMVKEGFVITDKALISAPSTLKSINYYVKTMFYNNTTFVIKKLPVNLSVSYNITNSSYMLVVRTSNGTKLIKEFNETDIVLFPNKVIYEDKYIDIILEKIWLYEVLDEPVASLLLRVISHKPLMSVLAYITKRYINIYNNAYPIKPVIEPLIVQQYYDGKVLGKNDETRLFIQAHYITRYSGSPASVFVMKLPYIVIVSDR